MYVLVIEFDPGVCDACGNPWDCETDRCSWWWCWHSARLGVDPRVRSREVRQGRRRVPDPVEVNPDRKAGGL